jgi:hypothetical protein
MATQGKSFVLDNITFDLLTVVQKKSRALEAYQRYLADSRRDPEVAKVIERIRLQDEQHVQELVPHLARLLGQEATMGVSQQQGGARTQPQQGGGGSGRS